MKLLSKVGMGDVYERFDNGDLLRNVTPSLRDKIMKDYYWTHHNCFKDMVQEQLNENGNCLIVDCQSYPSSPLIRDLDQTSIRPDFNIGIDPYHTPQKLIDASIAYFKKKGYSLGIDWPYSGTIVPIKFY